MRNVRAMATSTGECECDERRYRTLCYYPFSVRLPMRPSDHILIEDIMNNANVGEASAGRRVGWYEDARYERGRRVNRLRRDYKAGGQRRSQQFDRNISTERRSRVRSS